MDWTIAFITGLTTGGLGCLAVQGGLLTSTLAYQMEQDVKAHNHITGQKFKTKYRPADLLISPRKDSGLYHFGRSFRRIRFGSPTFAHHTGHPVYLYRDFHAWQWPADVKMSIPFFAILSSNRLLLSPVIFAGNQKTAQPC